MWALRRFCNPINSRKGLSLKTYRLVHSPLEVARCNLDGHTTELHELVLVVSDESQSGTRGYSSAIDFQKNLTGVRSFSSRTGSLSSGDKVSSGDEDDDLEDDFSELEASTDADAVQHKKVDENCISKAKLLREDSLDEKLAFSEDEQSLIDMEGNGYEDKSSRGRVHSELFEVIAVTHGSELSGVLDKWVEEGNEITTTEISETIITLQKRHMYFKALQLSEWSLLTNRLVYCEGDYARHLDLIAKVHGVAKAENYIQKLPESFKTEVVYRTLLKNHVSCFNVKKAEDLFNKMKDLGFPVSSFACNQMLLLYKKSDRKKMVNILSLMKKEDVEPSTFTYKLLIDTKGRSNDIDGMEQVFETMKEDGLTPDHEIQAIMARHYISGCQSVKAEAVLKEMEGNHLQDNRFALRSLILLYAALGKAEEVRRIWQACDSNPYLNECTAAIEAWGKLKNIEEAEAVFQKMETKFTYLTSKHYTVLLIVYAENKMLTKGEDLLKQMTDKGFQIGRLTWDSIVKLYVEAGQVEKADSVLQKFSQHNRVKPLLRSYMSIMTHYAKRGDVHNTEKLFYRLKQAGYLPRQIVFDTLIRAYTRAKAPPYGFYERMKADNVVPTKSFMAVFSHIDPFKKSAVSDLLD